MKALSVSLVLGFFLTLSRAAPHNTTHPMKMTMMGLCNSQYMDKHHLIGQYVPQCDAHGNFLPRQCSGSTGYCWCVNVMTGAKIPDTDTPPGTMPINCDMEMEMEAYCPYGWTHYEHECFIFINSNKTWIEAEYYCMFVGGNLASIHSYEQNHFLRSLTEDGTNSFPLTWIGANDAVHLTAWLWSDGSKCDYENWTRGYQLNETERCLQMNYGLHKKWINGPCNKSLPFICGKMI